MEQWSELKRFQVLITTFGVGELSAVNGIAGAFRSGCSRNAPCVLLIFGTYQRTRASLAHRGRTFNRPANEESTPPPYTG